MLCELCLAPIYQEIIDRSPRLKYCSTLCNKRAWYIRNKKTKRSIFDGNPIMGIEWENWFIKTFGAERPSRSFNTPADFIYEGRAIDLKVANLTGKYPKWTFRKPGKGHEEIDEYICLALDDNKLIKSFRIPAKEYPLHGMKVGRAYSKYDKYLFELPIVT